MRISYWSSDVCSSVLLPRLHQLACDPHAPDQRAEHEKSRQDLRPAEPAKDRTPAPGRIGYGGGRSEEHTSELQSLMRISYAVFCLKKKKTRLVQRTN